ncbi:hypothetical protein D7W81_32370 [Corallococcus aberystwythensis]|uniref:HlyD family secretion protein n=1 Tax=Corallococcus aberystwythensis TaxID=2316722 RepID=A0A3A8PLM2_9BACT|nr:hypothetical protein D7W81_32370 [Corallococcus aberystwythensis]
MGAVVTLGMFAGTVRVDRSARGPAWLQQGEWVNVGPSLHVLFPESYRPELAPGMTLEYQLPDMPAPLETVIEQVEGPEASLQFAKVRQPTDAAYREGAVLVRAHVSSRIDERAGEPGQAWVKLGTQRLIVAWFPGLRAALP